MDEEIYNLLISGDENAWESNSIIFDLDRCIVEYTEKDIVDRFVKLGRNEINEIASFSWLRTVSMLLCRVTRKESLSQSVCLIAVISTCSI